jgi:hypothetical protein
MPSERRRHKRWRRPELVIAQILTWADEYHQETGRWPRLSSGPIAGELEETWERVDNALRHGLRSLPGGSCLAQLLAERRGVRNPARPPKLTAEQILAWAAAHHQRTGEWPTCESGQVTDAPEGTWRAVNVALYHGLRGLPGGSSLARLLKRLKKKLP